MYARAVDDAEGRLRELRHEQWQDLGLAGVALGLGLAAAHRTPSLALPLVVGGVALGTLGIRALWRHWDLVDRMAGDPDAYVLADVLAYATRETTMDRRRTFAALVRLSLERGSDDFAAELAVLADELEDETLDLSPACAVACARMLREPGESALLNPALHRDLGSTVRRIRSGFTPHRP